MQSQSLLCYRWIPNWKRSSNTTGFRQKLHHCCYFFADLALKSTAHTFCLPNCTINSIKLQVMKKCFSGEKYYLLHLFSWKMQWEIKSCEYWWISETTPVVIKLCLNPLSDSTGEALTRCVMVTSQPNSLHGFNIFSQAEEAEVQ